MPTPNILQKILAQKTLEIAAAKNTISAQELHARISLTAPARSLRDALQRNGLSVIAEIKKASPSAGVIRENFNPSEIARSYINAGADAISMLTDEKFFQGSLAYIPQIRPFTPIPILRKDFIIDRYQLLEARAAGADAVLLIAAALKKAQLRDLLLQTRELGMDALVETHTAAEMETALDTGADIIGINNRSLETFRIDLATTEQLAPLVPEGAVIVAESGLHTRDDLQRMITAGVDAILVGTHFMKSPDPGAALQTFLYGREEC